MRSKIETVMNYLVDDAIETIGTVDHLGHYAKVYVTGEDALQAYEELFGTEPWSEDDIPAPGWYIIMTSGQGMLYWWHHTTDDGVEEEWDNILYEHEKFYDNEYY